MSRNPKVHGLVRGANLDLSHVKPLMVGEDVGVEESAVVWRQAGVVWSCLEEG